MDNAVSQGPKRHWLAAWLAGHHGHGSTILKPVVSEQAPQRKLKKLNINYFFKKKDGENSKSSRIRSLLPLSVDMLVFEAASVLSSVVRSLSLSFFL